MIGSVLFDRSVDSQEIPDVDSSFSQMNPPTHLVKLLFHPVHNCPPLEQPPVLAEVGMRHQWYFVVLSKFSPT